MLLYEDESYRIRGSCFKVYNALGGGIREKIIERALCSELKTQGLNIAKQGKIDIVYRGETVGVYIPDIVVENKIICELKSKPFITKEDKKQFWSYLKGSKFQLGFLINFGPKRLEIKRFVYTSPSA